MLMLVVPGHASAVRNNIYPTSLLCVNCIIELLSCFDWGGRLWVDELCTRSGKATALVIKRCCRLASIGGRRASAKLDSWRAPSFPARVHSGLRLPNGTHIHHATTRQRRPRWRPAHAHLDPVRRWLWLVVTARPLAPGAAAPVYPRRCFRSAGCVMCRPRGTQC